MTSNSLASVVIPTYYRNDQLPKAIESARDQTYDPVEIVVVDDSGERHAESVATEYDVHYIAHERNLGGNPTRNTGIEAATGDYIQLLDDDDRILPTKLEKQIDVFEANPSVGVVYCGLQQENGDLVFPKQENRGDVLEQALRISELHPCQTGTLLFRGDLLRDLLPLADREAGDDLGLKIRAATLTEFDFVDEILLVKGDSGNHRSSKLEFSNEIFSIVEEFDQLYDRFDDGVRKHAMRAAYQSRGTRLVNQRQWSLEAILCFAKALSYSDSPDPKLIGSFVSSIFGRRMYHATQDLYNTYLKRGTRFN
ncbi:glycosyltransferase family 2 protein [Salinirubellus sp. GCM10025818]|uniref:glycosyltransferase family 2 protein n=1 Tax=Salinirubellus TaxID=2162630 RepID=UPI0030D4375D